MSTLKDILGDHEFLRQHAVLGDMDTRMFLSICAYMNRQLVPAWGKESLEQVLVLLQRHCPNFFTRYYREKKRNLDSFEDFFRQHMGLLSTGDFEKDPDGILKKRVKEVKAMGYEVGKWYSYRPEPGDDDTSGDTGLAGIEGDPGHSIARGEAPRPESYQDDYLVEEIKILLNSGHAVICAVPLFTSWANDYTQASGSVSLHLGEPDSIMGFLPLLITGKDELTNRFTFTYFPVQGEGEYCFESWAEESSTGEPGTGTIPYEYIRKHMHPVFYALEAGQIPEKPVPPPPVRRDNLFSRPGALKKAGLAVVAVLAFLGLLYLLLGPGGGAPPVEDKLPAAGPGEEKTVEVTDFSQLVKPAEPGGDSTGETGQKEPAAGDEKEEEKQGTGQEKPVPQEPPVKPAKQEKEPGPLPRETGDKEPAGLGQSKSRKQQPRFYYIDKGYLYFQVHRGNTVGQLERALFLKKGDLSRYNPARVLRPLKLYAWLKVPLSRIRPYGIYKFKKGDRISALAKRFKASVYSIKVLNHTWSDSSIKPGHSALILTNRVK